MGTYPGWGIPFEEDTKRVVYRAGDIGLGVKHLEEIGPRTLKAHDWKNPKLIPGTVVAMRGWGRPTPGIFVAGSSEIVFQNIKVHYAEGMGLLAQMSENLTLDGFSVCLRGDDDPRYFTTQADATHFSNCKGKIISRNGLYENMMDDAINVHGTYLKVTKRVNDNAVIARYMHGQAYGFDWGFPGEIVQFIQSNTMEIVGSQNTISAIRPIDKPAVLGAREFEITFENALSDEINENNSIGI